MKLTDPIFLIGHARAGSTALAAAINWHPDIGPKHFPVSDAESLPDFMDSLLDYKTHLHYSEQLEQKDIWFRHLKGRGVFTHMGRELFAGRDALAPEARNLLVKELLEGYGSLRYFSKAPSNSFRIGLIRSLSENPRFIAIVRDGRVVVSSWARRPYGMRKRVNWGEVKTLYFRPKSAIRIFSRKWMETIDALETAMNQSQDVIIVDYNDLVTDWKVMIPKVMEHCGLAVHSEILDVKMKDRRGQWGKVIPKRYWKLLEDLTAAGNSWINKRKLQQDGVK